MLQDSKIELNEKTLTISLTPFGAGRIAMFELIGVVLAYWIVHQFATSEIAETNPQIRLVYLLPVLILWDLVKRVKKLILGDKYHFDRQLNELTINGLKESRLDEIEAVEINYNLKNDSDDRFLELKLRSNEKIRIREFGSKNSLINDGRAIAKFLKIKMMDNFPYGKELLWGETDADSTSIDNLNEHLKNTDYRR
jgi:hypothetical protein